MPGTLLRSPLYRDDWRYIERAALNDFSEEEWDLLNAQRHLYYAEHQVESILAMMRAAQHEPSFGYQINHYEHGLQSATMLFRDGYDAEDVVVALLHDIGFITCPDRHGAFSAELLGAYVDERNVWMLRHHQSFGSFGVSLSPGSSVLPRVEVARAPILRMDVDFRRGVRPKRRRPGLREPTARVFRTAPSGGVWAQTAPSCSIGLNSRWAPTGLNG